MNTILTDDDRQRVPDGWRELCRRLYVELFHCDQQMTSGKRPKWKQGETVRGVLADAKAALEAAAAPEAPARGEQATEPVRELVAKELERIAQDPPISGNEIAQARVLMAAQSIRDFGLSGGAAAPETPAQATRPPASQGEREAFEANENRLKKYPDDSLTRYPDAPDEYMLPLVQARWVGWQARAALAQKVQA